MLKLLPVATTGLGLFLALPAAVLDDPDLGSLTSALRETERAIEVLRGVETRLAAGDAEAPALIKGLTEPPALAGPPLDAELERLRAEVNLLQAEVDVIEGFRAGLPPGPLAPISGAGADGGAQPGTPAGANAASEPAAPPPVSTGLDPALLAALRPGAPRGAQPEAAASASASAAPGAAPHASITPPGASPAAPLPSPEAPGYSADPIRHAEACLLAGRLQEGLALIEARPEPEAVAIKAHFLERLGRVDEAIVALESVVGRLPEGTASRRAESDLEFLRWKRDFLTRLPARGAEGGR